MYTPSLAHDSVHLAVSLQEDVLAGQQLVLANSILGAVRPVLELLDVDWAQKEDTSSNSTINPDTRAIKLKHLHLHLKNKTKKILVKCIFFLFDMYS